MSEHIGEIAALGTSVFWTFTALAFEHAAVRIGSLALNILRLAVALCIFVALGLVVRGEAIPLGAGGSAWFWLTLSGLVGFVFGDIFLFQAYIDIGARTTQVIFASAPLITALIGYFALGERIAAVGLVGMACVVAGICLVILDKRGQGATSAVVASRRLRGVLCAALGAVGQAGGLVLSKIGAPSSDPFAATEIRVIAGLTGFVLLALLLGRLGEARRAVQDRGAMGSLVVGSFFGPFLGVSLGLFAVQRASSGVAATLMGLTPILIILPSVVLKKERVTLREVAGAAVAVGGSALLFLS